jgi:hypothetical protein
MVMCPWESEHAMSACVYLRGGAGRLSRNGDTLFGEEQNCYRFIWLPWVSIEGYSSGLLFDIDGYSEVILRIRIIVSFTEASRQLPDL